MKKKKSTSVIYFIVMRSNSSTTGSCWNNWWVLTEESQHEDAIVSYSQLVGIFKVISGHKVVVLHHQQHNHTQTASESFLFPLINARGGGILLALFIMDEVQLYHDPSSHQGNGCLFFASLGFIIGGQSGGDVVGGGVRKSTSIFFIFKERWGRSK